MVGLVDFIAPILGCVALAKYVLGWGNRCKLAGRCGALNHLYGSGLPNTIT